MSMRWLSEAGGKRAECADRYAPKCTVFRGKSHAILEAKSSQVYPLQEKTYICTSARPLTDPLNPNSQLKASHNFSDGCFFKPKLVDKIIELFADTHFVRCRVTVPKMVGALLEGSSTLKATFVFKIQARHIKKNRSTMKTEALPSF